MNFSDVEKYISNDRLSSYTALLGTTDINKTLGAYYWNKALGGPIYSFLQCLEVSLRNSIHIEAKSKFGRETWYEPLCRKVGDKVRRDQRRRGRNPTNTANESKLRETIDKLRSSARPVSSANVISSLTFGFWVNLLKNDYASGDKSLLWPELLPKVFPNAPAGITLRSIYDELREINLLRNRFSHHEPLWKSGTITNVDDAIYFLNGEVAKVMKYIRYINEHRANLLERSSAYKDFCGLNTKHSFEIYLGEQRNILSLQKFRSNLNLHLKNASEKNKMLFIRRNGRFIARLSGY